MGGLQRANRGRGPQPGTLPAEERRLPHRLAPARHAARAEGPGVQHAGGVRDERERCRRRDDRCRSRVGAPRCTHDGLAYRTLAVRQPLLHPPSAALHRSPFLSARSIMLHRTTFEFDDERAHVVLPRGVHWLPYYAANGTRVLAAITADHRLVMSREIVRDEDAERARADCWHALDFLDPTLSADLSA